MDHGLGKCIECCDLPVTIRCVLEQGVPVTVTKFAVPLGWYISHLALMPKFNTDF